MWLGLGQESVPLPAQAAGRRRLSQSCLAVWHLGAQSA